MTEPIDDDPRQAEHDRKTDLAGLTEAAERLDGLADMADLMSDAAGADQLREAAARARLRAMTFLDDPPSV